MTTTPDVEFRRIPRGWHWHAVVLNERSGVIGLCDDTPSLQDGPERLLNHVPDGARMCPACTRAAETIATLVLHASPSVSAATLARMTAADTEGTE